MDAAAADEGSGARRASAGALVEASGGRAKRVPLFDADPFFGRAGGIAGVGPVLDGLVLPAGADVDVLGVVRPAGGGQPLRVTDGAGWHRAVAGRCAALVVDLSHEARGPAADVLDGLGVVAGELGVPLHRVVVCGGGPASGAVVASRRGGGPGLLVVAHDGRLDAMLERAMRSGLAEVGHRLLDRAGEPEKVALCLNGRGRAHQIVLAHLLVRDGHRDAVHLTFGARERLKGAGGPQRAVMLPPLCRRFGLDGEEVVRSLLACRFDAGPAPEGEADPLDPQVYGRAVFSVVAEADMTGLGGAPSTLAALPPLLFGHPVLVFGGPGTVGALERLGFDLFRDVIDAGYDRVPDRVERFARAYAALDGLLPRARAIFRTPAARQRLHDNVALFEGALLTRLRQRTREAVAHALAPGGVPEAGAPVPAAARSPGRTALVDLRAHFGVRLGPTSLWDVLEDLPLPAELGVDVLLYYRIQDWRRFRTGVEAIPRWPDALRGVADGRRAGLLLDLSDEGVPFAPDFAGAAAALAGWVGVPLERVVLAQTNTAFGRNLRRSGAVPAEAKRIRHIHHNDWAYRTLVLAEDGGLIERGHRAIDRPGPRAKAALCLNGKPRAHRLLLAHLLARDGLRDRVHLSFVGQRLVEAGREPLRVTLGPLCRPHGVAPEAVVAFGESHVFDQRAEIADRVTTTLALDVEPELYEATRFSLVTESEATNGDVVRFTEKPLKPLLMGHPLIVFGNPFTVRALTALGFDLLTDVIDDGYDALTDRVARFDRCYRGAKALLASAETVLGSAEVRDRLHRNVDLFGGTLRAAMRADTRARVLDALRPGDGTAACEGDGG